MIRSVSGGPYIQVDGGHPSASYIYDNGMNKPMSGMVRYINNQFEVYDGHTWHQISIGHATVKLTNEASKAIDWALQQMQEQADIEQLEKDHPAVKIAHDNLKRAAEQLKATIILSKDQEDKISPWEKLQANFP